VNFHPKAAEINTWIGSTVDRLAQFLEYNTADPSGYIAQDRCAPAAWKMTDMANFCRAIEWTQECKPVQKAILDAYVALTSCTYGGEYPLDGFGALRAIVDQASQMSAHFAQQCDGLQTYGCTEEEWRDVTDDLHTWQELLGDARAAARSVSSEPGSVRPSGFEEVQEPSEAGSEGRRNRYMPLLLR
jgi:hypothetical protein